MTGFELHEYETQYVRSLLDETPNPSPDQEHEVAAPNLDAG